MFSPEQVRLLQKALAPEVDNTLELGPLSVPITSPHTLVMPFDESRKGSKKKGCTVSPLNLAFAYVLSVFLICLCLFTHSLLPLTGAFPILMAVTFLDACVLRGGEGGGTCVLGVILWCIWASLLVYALLLKSVHIGVVACVVFSLLQGVLATNKNTTSVYTIVLTVAGTVGVCVAAVAHFTVIPGGRCLYIASVCVTLQCLCTVLLSRTVHVSIGLELD